MSVWLRPTVETDLEFVLAAEKDGAPFVSQWTREEHQAALKNSDIDHLIVALAEHQSVGYLILAGLDSPHRSLELKRLVITDQNKGYGSIALRLLLKHAFLKCSAHRVWLDVKDYNHKAKSVYKKQGFVVEGILRECLKTKDGFESLIVMSMLRSEYDKQLGNAG